MLLSCLATILLAGTALVASANPYKEIKVCAKKFLAIVIYLWNLSPPAPHKNAILLHCSIVDVAEIASKISELLPQMTDFIGQFNTVIITNNINVITDSVGNMEVEGPATLSDIEIERIGKRIGIIDRLIIARGEQVSDLIQKGIELEAQLKREDANYTSQLVDKIKEFKKLSSSYKH